MSCLSNCNTCDHKQHPDGGWCYMFRHEPNGSCAKHTPMRTQRKPLTDEQIVAELEQENRLIRARNERLERTIAGIVPRLEQACGATAMPPLIIKKFIEEHAA